MSVSLLKMCQLCQDMRRVCCLLSCLLLSHLDVFSASLSSEFVHHRVVLFQLGFDCNCLLSFTVLCRTVWLSKPLVSSSSFLITLCRCNLHACLSARTCVLAQSLPHLRASLPIDLTFSLASSRSGHHHYDATVVSFTILSPVPGLSPQTTPSPLPPSPLARHTLD
jgi:hypothetical protein